MPDVNEHLAEIDKNIEDIQRVFLLLMGSEYTSNTRQFAAIDAAQAALANLQEEEIHTLRKVFETTDYTD